MEYYDVSSGVTSTGRIIGSFVGMRVLSGGTAVLTTVNAEGECLVFSGGQATNTTINNIGRMYVSSGGTATAATVQSGGIISVSSGATVSGVDLTKGARFYFDVASRTYIQGTNRGTTFEIKDGNLSIFTVYYEAALHVFNGCTANKITVSSGGACMSATAQP